MAPALKVYIKYTPPKGGDAALETTLKLKVPRKWRDGPVRNLLTTFLEHFNSKFGPGRTLAAHDVYLQNAKGEKLAGDDVVSACVGHQTTVRVKHVARVAGAAAAALQRAGTTGFSAAPVKPPRHPVRLPDQG